MSVVQTMLVVVQRNITNNIDAGGDKADVEEEEIFDDVMDDTDRQSSAPCVTNVT